ncbi:MAG TPA: homoserine O-succinyltransferase, partial [Longimicrobiales bacterium]|nr:homoserine O-succinyltransferase [Longimicrobiales bacterium]
MSSVLEPAVSTTADIGQLDLEHGGHIEDAHVAFSVHGDADLPAVLVLGGISAGRHILTADGVRSGWWPGVVGPGSALDPAHHRLVGVDYVAGRGDSSSPAPAGEWPVITTGDQAGAIIALLDRLGIERLHAVVGASYGGMVALALAERFGTRLDRVVAICAAHRAHPMATAIRSIQRRVIRLAAMAEDAAGGVAIARALAMTTYRTAAEFDERFGGAPSIAAGAVRFPVDSYLDHHGHDYAASFPAQSFLALSQSLDLHHVNPSRISAECALICFDSDTLVPPADVHVLARALPREPALTCISSRYGHDGFLKEPRAVSSAIAAALNGTSAPTTSYAARSTASSTNGAGSSRSIGTDGSRSAAGAP